MYIRSIVAFFGTVAIGIVFCGVIQWRDIKPPPYICFSSGNVDIAALLKPTAINTSFCTDAIAAIEKNCHNMLVVAVIYITTTIGILFATLLLVIAAGWTVAIDL